MFHYRGYTVSMSTIFGNKVPSIAVFKEGTLKEEGYFNSVQEAIEFINYA